MNTVRTRCTQQCNKRDLLFELSFALLFLVTKEALYKFVMKLHFGHVQGLHLETIHSDGKFGSEKKNNRKYRKSSAHAETKKTTEYTEEIFWQLKSRNDLMSILNNTVWLTLNTNYFTLNKYRLEKWKIISFL